MFCLVPVIDVVPSSCCVQLRSLTVCLVPSSASLCSSPGVLLSLVPLVWWFFCFILQNKGTEQEKHLDQSLLLGGKVWMWSPGLGSAWSPRLRLFLMQKRAEHREDVLEDINVEISQFTVSISNVVDFWRRLALNAFITLYSCEAQNIAGLKYPTSPRSTELMNHKNPDQRICFSCHSFLVL